MSSLEPHVSTALGDGVGEADYGVTFLGADVAKVRHAGLRVKEVAEVRIGQGGSALDRRWRELGREGDGE